MEQPFYGQKLTSKRPNCHVVTDNNDRNRRRNGSFTSEYEPSDFLNAIDELDTPTLTNIAAYLDCGKGTAHRYLTELQNQDKVKSTEIGNVLLWSRTA
jgi:hypothetical protein